MATLSFLAARAAPPLAFGLALAGGVSLARAGERLGARRGYAVSFAALLETIAVVGPARMGAPLLQSATAPLLGIQQARRTRRVWQVLGATLIRIVYNVVTTAFFIWVIAGGLDAYAGTYDAVTGRLPLVPNGPVAALVVTAAGIVVGAAIASTIQVGVCARGLRRWPADAPLSAPQAAPGLAEGRRRFDPRAVVLAGAVMFGGLLSSTAWPVLAAAVAWLAVAWLIARPDRGVAREGALLAGLLGLGAFAFTAIPGLGLALAGRRGARAALLVLAATWLRGAAGAAGMREVTRRTLRRLRRVPAMREAAAVFEHLGSTRGLGASARALLGAVRSGSKRPLAVVDSVLDWVAVESHGFRPVRAPRAPALRLRVRDAVLAVSAAAPLAALGVDGP